MSLLIKALDKAQNAKTEQTEAEKAKASNKSETEIDSDSELSLSPTGSSLAEPSIASAVAESSVVQSSSSAVKTPPVLTSPPTSNLSSKNAASVFSAKGIEASNQNSKLALIAGAGLLALLGLGFYYYQFVNTPDLVISPRPVVLQPVPQSSQSEIKANTTLPDAPVAPLQTAKTAIPPDSETGESIQLADRQENTTKNLSKKHAVNEDDEFAVDENSEITDETLVTTKTNKKGGKTKILQFGKAIASDSASITVTKTKSEISGNPTLMSAYEAYNAGNDTEAQKLYKQVLQHDVRNVDALLGLGAIASRQGRIADANGWYGKVLEVDPRNNLAQTALLDNQLQADQSQVNAQDSESRLKSMLAKHPEDVNLHVALGNLYAEQNQWPAAQQAYFDAYRLHESADNAFNLAVSLDQMGKSKLALPYYQRALELAQSSPNSIDKAALEARIAAIQ
jgi:tetratricopeptide (TPR) repeat protein